MKIRHILAPTLLLLLVATARPGRAQTQAIANPKLFDESLKAAAEAVKQYGAADDQERLARVSRIGYELAQQSDFQKYPFVFGIVKMPEPNAFALPAGQIFITTGMLDLGLDDDMLANVLGHEIGHVVHEHAIHMQRRQTLMTVLGNLLVAGVAIGESRSGNHLPSAQAPYDPRVGYQDQGGNLIQGAAAASLVVSELLLRSYSRDNEDEADKEGQSLAAAAGYSPDGARRLWDLMNSRAPQLKEYGYWQTHPFSDVRQRAAEARKSTWTVQGKKSADDYRKRTQTALVTYMRQAHGKPDPAVTDFVKQAVLSSWPQGKESDALRLEKLHKRRDDELARPVLSRDYGAVLKMYRKELAEVKTVEPKSDLISALDGEISDLEVKRKDLYPRAVKVLEGGIYETSFLESFLSNFPEATQVPEVALALGDANARLGNRTEAVTQYLKAWEAGPQSTEGKRAAAGLRVLAPNLQELAALQQMAEQTKDPELKHLADERLAAIAKSYDDIKNGAEYLRRYPEGPYVVPVIERLNVLADNLYGEVVLYRSVGDTLKAMERINKILTDAPLSPAAAKLRDQAVLEAKAG
ncbi:MAG TPA: M48 family metalloprotease [Thermoanaerobaculia bacterium]|nr:M48 family metalloprotease [Thermoanaerobaculia bacterium]